MVSNRLYISNYDFVSFRYSVFDGVSWITSQVLLHLCNAHPSYSNHKHLITHRSQPTPSEISPLSVFWVMMTTYLPLPLKKVTSFTSSLFIISCHYPVEPDIKLGALYSVDKMPDHCGSLFDHKKSKLVQLPIYDIDNKLIPTFQLSPSSCQNYHYGKMLSSMLCILAESCEPLTSLPTEHNLSVRGVRALDQVEFQGGYRR